jgi:hypothetical protein
MIDCSKMTWKEIHVVLARNPTWSDCYKKAKAEQAHRLRKYTVVASVATGLIVVAVEIFWK